MYMFYYYFDILSGSMSDIGCINAVALSFLMHLVDVHMAYQHTCNIITFHYYSLFGRHHLAFDPHFSISHTCTQTPSDLSTDEITLWRSLSRLGKIPEYYKVLCLASCNCIFDQSLFEPKKSFHFLALLSICYSQIA